ncbi:hypothetical protein [Tenacibaculum sp.]|uniref:hypothetical protein n=1 Tax=Tenacibaculum sp. TaxID=1906242 RepID=UPI003AA7B866
MKTTKRIAIIAMMGVSFGIKAQAKAITDTGDKVGIGTTSPSQKLEVKGKVLLKSDSYVHYAIERENGAQSIHGITSNTHDAFLSSSGNLKFLTNYNGTSYNTAMFVNHEGNVGIGTTSPSEKLEVKEGNIRIYGVNTSRYIRFGEVNYQGAFINYDGTTNVLNIGVNNINTADTSNDYNAISIVRSGGNVGIGTTSPSEKLEVKDGNIRIEGLNTSRYIRFGEENYLGAFINYDGTANILNIGVNNVNAAEASNDYNAISIIRSSGKVGIGTTTTGSHKLAVEGSIGAREIKVEGSGWSDFVFENEYELPTLKEVENHIKENGHLKDIPSAKEVEKNGFFLGEMDAKLLQKIEELTLYTIEHEKKIKVLEKQNSKIEAQEKEIEELKKQNSKIQELEKLVKKLIEDKK